MAGKQKIDENTKSSDGIGHAADPYDAGDTSRGADNKTGGETYDGVTKSQVLHAIMSKYAELGTDKLHNIYKGLDSPSGESSRGADNKGGEKSELHLSPSDVKGKSPEEPVNRGGSAETVHSSKPGRGGEDALVYTSPTAVRPFHAKEDIDQIFAGEDLTEELLEKATIVFEAAVNARLISEVARLEEEAEVRLEEALEDMRIEVTEAVDKYLSYVAEQWVEENAVAIDTGLKNEMAEEFILGLKSLFESNYIEIPETKVDVVSEMVSKIEELESQLNEEIEKNLSLQESKAELQVNEIFESACDNLAATQAEKLKVLAEGITYSSPAEYAKKINIIKETYFRGTVSPDASEMLNEEVDLYEDESQNITGPMAAYVRAAANGVKK